VASAITGDASSDEISLDIFDIQVLDIVFQAY
jgi:hypothetical protein